VYRGAIEKARDAIELAALANSASTAAERLQQQARARLIAKMPPPAKPEGWEALERLGVAAVMRVDKTGWHGKRVGALSKALAIAAGIDPLHALEIGFAAELHDIGKIAIPESILDKPGPLTAEEWALMQQHTIAGERIILASPALADVAPLVRSSHERWDGSGYPDRLAGEAIPFGARIIAVCDSYHAMTSDRTYRRALSPEVALTELSTCSGSQFDPRVVDAFLRRRGLATGAPGPSAVPAPAEIIAARA
jgi:HD-GYP domain-containing protein (c-di-GMP phosphodiesterase class II)